MSQNEEQNQIEDIYKKTMDKLVDISLQVKKIMIEYRQKRDTRRIEELKNKIQNNE